MSNPGFHVVVTVEGAKDLTTKIKANLIPHLSKVVDEASKAGADAAKRAIVDARRVDTGRMRDSNKVEPALQEGPVAAGAFYNDTPYAIYHEYGTRNYSAVHFMQRGARVAQKALYDGLNRLIAGGKK